jgi:hypothetical protein
MKFEIQVSTAVRMMMMMMMIWVLAQSRVTGRCQAFGEACYLRLQGFSQKNKNFLQKSYVRLGSDRSVAGFCISGVGPPDSAGLFTSLVIWVI